MILRSTSKKESKCTKPNEGRSKEQRCLELLSLSNSGTTGKRATILVTYHHSKMHQFWRTKKKKGMEKNRNKSEISFWTRMLTIICKKTNKIRKLSSVIIDSSKDHQCVLKKKNPKVSPHRWLIHWEGGVENKLAFKWRNMVVTTFPK